MRTLDQHCFDTSHRSELCNGMNVGARNLHRPAEAAAQVTARQEQSEATAEATEFEVDAATLKMMDEADANVKAGRWSKPADLEKYAKYGE